MSLQFQALELRDAAVSHHLELRHGETPPCCTLHLSMQSYHADIPDPSLG